MYILILKLNEFNSLTYIRFELTYREKRIMWETALKDRFNWSSAIFKVISIKMSKNYFMCTYMCANTSKNFLQSNSISRFQIETFHLNNNNAQILQALRRLVSHNEIFTIQSKFANYCRIETAKKYFFLLVKKWSF